MRRVDVTRSHIVPLSWPVDAGIWSSVELFSQLSNDLRLRGLHSPGITVAHREVDLWEQVYIASTIERYSFGSPHLQNISEKTGPLTVKITKVFTLERVSYYIIVLTCLQWHHQVEGWMGSQDGKILHIYVTWTIVNRVSWRREKALQEESYIHRSGRAL